LLILLINTIVLGGVLRGF